MKVQLFVLSLVLAVPLTAVAQGNKSYRCALGGNVRRVEIYYETGVVVPCEVQYFKDTEAPGERQVLWRALNESGYCEARTREFVAKLEGLGWQCEAGEGPSGAAAPEEEAADDTDVLGAPNP